MPVYNCSRCRNVSFRFCVLIACSLVISVGLKAQPATFMNDGVPEDLSGVHFYLITVDVGDAVWDNFGHTALRVFDENNNIDIVFNWGNFSFSGGVVGFSWNFFKGIMNYSLVANSPSYEFAQYRVQERAVWQDRINLTNPQKERLYRRLMWNFEPENIVYEYQYFFDNCTTRVRDYLDEALTGKIRTQFSNETSETFRDQVQAHYKSVGLISFSLDVLMNSNIDRNMTEWEDMFLPLRFRERLMEIRSDVAENGEQLMLLSDPQLIMEFPPPTSQSSPYQIVYLLFLLPMLFLALMLKRIPQSYFSTHSRIGFMFAGINFRIFGLICLLVSVLSGVYGILMLGSWFVSDHIDTHHNINLLLFWPTDILGILVALRLIFVSEPWPITHNSTPFINYYLLAHILGIFLYGIIALFELTTQSIGNIALHIVPTFLLFILFIWIVGFVPAKSKSMFF